MATPAYYMDPRSPVGVQIDPATGIAYSMAPMTNFYGPQPHVLTVNSQPSYIASATALPEVPQYMLDYNAQLARIIMEGLRGRGTSAGRNNSSPVNTATTNTQAAPSIDLSGQLVSAHEPSESAQIESSPGGGSLLRNTLLFASGAPLLYAAFRNWWNNRGGGNGGPNPPQFPPGGGAIPQPAAPILPALPPAEAMAWPGAGPIPQPAAPARPALPPGEEIIDVEPVTPSVWESSVQSSLQRAQDAINRANIPDASLLDQIRGQLAPAYVPWNALSQAVGTYLNRVPAPLPSTTTQQLPLLPPIPTPYGPIFIP